MKSYKIRPEFMQEWGNLATEDTIVTHDEVVQFAKDWEVSVEELLEQLKEEYNAQG